MKHRYYVRNFFKPQLLYRIKPNKNGKRKPTNSLYSHAYGKTCIAENYLDFACLGVFFNEKGTWKEEKRNIIMNLNKQKPGEEEGHLIYVKTISEFQLQRKGNNS